MTCPARTLADVLRDEADLNALWLADQALGGLPALAASTVSLLTGGPHVGRARARLAAADGRSESPRETLTRWVRWQAGLRPEPQVVVRLDGRAVARVDLAFRRERVAVEADGTAVHGSVEAVYADRRRQNLLAAAGWVVVRVTWADLMRDPDRVVAELRAVLAQRGT